ncbi:outer membrane protein [Aureimonas endophytica]|uniref:Outer membrane protein n=1 Tax=Aureimonas endophytica TaxID=2027858 RepID=A0A917A2Y9_9HYPH|nr:outer membrane beta-barrel protein [Aureimonas endophytica]GGE24161.1 outer membrane protein [Aureimonas endophytica]
MKRFALLLAATALATPAFAADVITEEPPAPAPVELAPAYNWTGLYIGGQAGVAIGGSNGAIGGFGDYPYDVLTYSKDSSTGFTGGGHIGYDYQINNFIIGGVADFNYVDVNKGNGATFENLAGTGNSLTNDVDINYFGTVRGKVGYAMDRVAVYATGGLAYGGVDNDVSTSGFTSPGGTVYSASVERDEDKVGYTVGGGVDFLATQNISFGLEYLYTDLGKAKTETTFNAVGASAFGDPASFTTETKTDLDFHTIMAKASYRFN